MTVVREFHEAFNLPCADHPTPIEDDRVRLRLKLINEEHKEVKKDFSKLLAAKTTEQKLEAMRLLLKELSDLRYVIEGTAVEMGLDIDGAYVEVHRSNMSKLGADGKPIYREDGKVLKGPHYREPDMSKFVPDIIDIEEASDG